MEKLGQCYRINLQEHRKRATQHHTMTLTVVVGSSGSGKTTFLNDTVKSHKCTYIRQYHNLRPYITVTDIPQFDPARLPFWDTYVREGTAATIKVGGTMAGEFTAGLSGGQRKILLFELICQRTANQSDLLLVLDEPFAGVTEDFVPFIVHRLHELRLEHNVLLVTNDHVEALLKMADTTLVVSAIDRTKVQIRRGGQNVATVSRPKAILALSVGNEFAYPSAVSNTDLLFFWKVEVAHNGALWGVAASNVVAFALLVTTFWNSTLEAIALIILGTNTVAFICLFPYLVSLTDWRNRLMEEAEALLHASISVNIRLKMIATMLLILWASVLQYAVINVVIADGSGVGQATFAIALMLDTSYVAVPFLFFGLYTNLPFETADILSLLPEMCSIFFSTTFSPGAGIAALKDLRYLFPRFYFWCMLPGVQTDMEGCPTFDENLNLLYMMLTSLLWLGLLFTCKRIKAMRRSSRQKQSALQQAALRDDEFEGLQMILYGGTSSSNAANNDQMRRRYKTWKSGASTVYC